MSGGRIALVGCGERKLDHPVPAQDLYSSDLFKKRRAYVERYCQRWFILSALHGLVPPDKMLAPYDQSMTRLGKSERDWWANDVVRALRKAGVVAEGDQVEIHAGVDYWKLLSWRLHAAGFVVITPTAGLSIGLQLHWYARRLERPQDGAEGEDRA